ncbi:hypothetical protein HDU96_002015 [Phlyctochytrium bullatum]|nr:hypothetical protein HDU96_002015 [Phlyctochytrium bullatum]
MFDISVELTWHLGLSIALLVWLLLTATPALIRSFPAVIHRLTHLFSAPDVLEPEETASLLGSARNSSRTFEEAGSHTEEDPEWEVAHYHTTSKLRGFSWPWRFGVFVIAAGAAGAFSRGVVASATTLKEKGDSIPAVVAVIAATLLHVTLATLSLFVGLLDPTRLGGHRSHPVSIERAKRNAVQLLFALTPYFVALAVFAIAVPSVAVVPGLSFLCVVGAGTVGLVNNGVTLGKLQKKRDEDGLIPSPEEDASILSRLTVYWLSPLMTYGFVETIQDKDIWNTQKSLTTSTILTAFHDAEASHGPTTKPSLIRTLWHLHWATLASQFLLSVLDSLLAFTGTFFLNRILASVPLTGASPRTAYAHVLGMLVFSILSALVNSAESQMVTRLGVKIRNLLSALIYAKALRRAPVAVDADKEKERAASVGKVVNLMAVDATTIGEWIGYVYSPFLTAMKIAVCVGALVYLLGWAALAGVGVLTLLLFSGGPLANTINKGYAEHKAAVDRRVNAFNEMVQGIKIIKFFAWETRFFTKIDDLRQKELNLRWRNQVLETLNRLLWYSAPFMTSLTTLGFYTVVMNKELNAEVGFTALSLFTVLKSPLEQFPDTIIQLLDALVSVRRIEAFLNEDDLEQQSAVRSTLGFANASFVWHKPQKGDGKKPAGPPKTWKNLWGLLPLRKPVETGSSDDAGGEEEPAVFELKGLSADFANGKLSVIVGATGSGKTTLLHSLLGETHLTQGVLFTPSNTPIAYVPQAAWLLNASIRDNILFGTPLDESRYRSVVKACALERDLELLEGGDLTEVGEKGINLSGGQKQRIALARACYSRAKVVLLDDPLSAVDAPTAKQLMEECVLGLMEGRTRILVTNAAGLAIPRADDLYVLHAGRIIHQGPVESVLRDLKAGADSGSRYAPSVADSASLASFSTSTLVPGSSAFTDSLRDLADTVLAERQKHLAGNGGARNEETSAEVASLPKGVLVSEEEGKRLVKDETVNEGAVDPEVYRIYLRATGGIKYIAVLLIGYSLNHLATLSLDGIVYLWCESYTKTVKLLTDVVAANAAATAASSSVGALALSNPLSFLDAFASSSGHPNVSSATTEEAQANGGGSREIAIKFSLIYFGLAVFCLTVIVLRLLILAYGSLSAGRNIHRQLMMRLLHSPLRFFEVTPVGRIMNRMTKDMAAVDRSIGSSVGNTTYSILLILFIILAIARQIPILLVLLLPIGYIYFLIGQLFIRTCRSLKRLDSVARSPIYSHFSETLMGLTVIRAFRDSERFFRECRKRIDAYSRIDYLLSISYTWLSVRIQLISSLIVGIIGLLLLAAAIGKNLTGLCLTFAMQIATYMAHLVWLQSWMESNMNSMERANEYLQLEQEAPAVVEHMRPPQNWPSEGRISIKDLRLKYASDLPDVLKGMSIEVGAMEKVAVVGRTGAGKSSLALALFRIVEPSGGSIEIDAVDVLRLGLEDLRSNLTIIPQDPVLFTGTIRSNLDPFESKSDAELWLALKRAHLVNAIPSGSPLQASSTPSTPPKPLKRADGSNDTLISGDDSSINEEANGSTLNLDTPIAEGGSNLSAGQRQLLCLARALARKSRIIVMDEATASVDAETDSRIQQTIREEFSDCTVITIAHRLKTIVDYDRVVVLDQGVVAETGTALSLIQDSPRGIFCKMCEESGEFDELPQTAKQTDSPKNPASPIGSPKTGSPKSGSPRATTPRLGSKLGTPTNLSRAPSANKVSAPFSSVQATVDKADIVKSIKADQEAASASNSRPVTAKNGMSTEAFVKTMPRSGGWVGWYTTADSEMTKIFFEVALAIDQQGKLTGEPREESSPFSCEGTVSRNEPHQVTFVETEKFGHDIQFDGVFVEGAIAGRWHKVGGEPRGRLCLFRISDKDASYRETFRPGRWAGCCWSEREKDWLQVSFSWLEVRDGIVYGKDETTDDNVFITTRGMFEAATGKIKIMVTEWFEQDSTFRVYSGVVAKDGHIRGLWTSTENRDLEDDGSMYDDVPEEEDEATFRIWRVDGEDDIEWLPKKGHPEMNPRYPETKWKGTWIYEGGVQSPDHCTWNLRFLAKGNRIQGEGISILDNMEEGFVCDGIYDPIKKTIKLYQSYLTTLSIYVYDLVLQDDGSYSGTGSSRDDSDGLIVDFKLTPI